VGTESKVAPPAQDVAIELAYAKYMAALATHVPRPAVRFSTDARDPLPALPVLSSMAAPKLAK